MSATFEQCISAARARLLGRIEEIQVMRDSDMKRFKVKNAAYVARLESYTDAIVALVRLHKQLGQ